MVKALSYAEVNQIIASFDNRFEDKRNKAMILVLVDCGLRLGELLNLTLSNVNMEQQILKVSGKTGERIVRIGTTSAKALLKYMVARNMVNGHTDQLWITKEGSGLKDSSVETLFIKLSKKTGIAVHPHLLRHTFATLWLKNSNSQMLQRLLGHTTLMMTNRYCQAVGCYDAVEAHKRFSPIDSLKI